MPHQKRGNLLASAESFCNAFASQAPLDEILSHFSSICPSEVLAHEHGLKQLAPFLGREFRGIKEVKKYFETIKSHLTYDNMKFSNYIVDAAENKVSVKGEAQFTWTSTAQSWDEIFTYQLAFDEEGKILKYEVWADSGAAYLASKGLLEGED